MDSPFGKLRSNKRLTYDELNIRVLIGSCICSQRTTASPIPSDSSSRRIADRASFSEAKSAATPFDCGALVRNAMREPAFSSTSVEKSELP
jgi:hypothetical protein